MTKLQIGVKLDPEIKEKFEKLAQEERLNMSEGIRHLILEAIARGYIVKERHEAVKKAEVVQWQ